MTEIIEGRAPKITSGSVGSHPGAKVILSLLLVFFGFFFLAVCTWAPPDGSFVPETIADDVLQSSSSASPRLVSISFTNLTSSTKEGRSLTAPISGSFRAGRLTAVMGSSGCGKSTVLELIRNLPGRRVQGEVRLTSHSRAGDLSDGSAAHHSNVIAAVPQEDSMHTELSAYGNLWSSASLRVSNVEDAVQMTVRLLQMEMFINKRVGKLTDHSQRLSGGQRKKVNIGMALALNPPVLILDEPTSGLDSSSSYDLSLRLSDLAKLGKTVVAIIHTPPAHAFARFDDLLLLAEGGHVVYHGPTDRALSYLAGIGVTPSGVPLGVNFSNPADFLAEVVKGEVPFQSTAALLGGGGGGRGASALRRERVAALGDLWRAECERALASLRRQTTAGSDDTEGLAQGLYCLDVMRVVEAARGAHPPTFLDGKVHSKGGGSSSPSSVNRLQHYYALWWRSNKLFLLDFGTFALILAIGSMVGALYFSKATQAGCHLSGLAKAVGPAFALGSSFVAAVASLQLLRVEATTSMMFRDKVSGVSPSSLFFVKMAVGCAYAVVIQSLFFAAYIFAFRLSKIAYDLQHHVHATEAAPHSPARGATGSAPLTVLSRPSTDAASAPMASAQQSDELVIPLVMWNFRSMVHLFTGQLLNHLVVQGVVMWLTAAEEPSETLPFYGIMLYFTFALILNMFDEPFYSLSPISHLMDLQIALELEATRFAKAKARLDDFYIALQGHACEDDFFNSTQGVQWFLKLSREELEDGESTLTSLAPFVTETLSRGVEVSQMLDLPRLPGLFPQPTRFSMKAMMLKREQTDHNLVIKNYYKRKDPWTAFPWLLALAFTTLLTAWAALCELRSVEACILTCVLFFFARQYVFKQEAPTRLDVAPPPPPAKSYANPIRSEAGATVSTTAATPPTETASKLRLLQIFPILFNGLIFASWTYFLFSAATRMSWGGGGGLSYLFTIAIEIVPDDAFYPQRKSLLTALLLEGVAVIFHATWVKAASSVSLRRAAVAAEVRPPTPPSKSSPFFAPLLKLRPPFVWHAEWMFSDRPSSNIILVAIHKILFFCFVLFLPSHLLAHHQEEESFRGTSVSFTILLNAAVCLAASAYSIFVLSFKLLMRPAEKPTGNHASKLQTNPSRKFGPLYYVVRILLFLQCFFFYLGVSGPLLFTEGLIDYKFASAKEVFDFNVVRGISTVYFVVLAPSRILDGISMLQRLRRSVAGRFEAAAASSASNTKNKTA